MAKSLISTNGNVSYSINEYAVDTVEDLKTLPICAMGSSAIVISTGDVYMKNGEGNWVKL